MKRIIAIGGGEINELETLEIDKEIVRLSNINKPRILFIPTASRDADGYIDSFNSLFKEKLGCETDSLLLIKNRISEDEIRERIISSDIIYVGGGNTKMMMDIWKKNKVDKYLREAYDKGIVLCGMSAGSICWFEAGQSDTEKYEAGNLDNFITVEGLGIIKAFHVPHYNENNRDIDMDNRIKNYSGIGIAIDNNCAIEITEKKYRILKSDKNAKAYKVFFLDEKVHKEELLSDKKYHNLEELFSF